MITSNVVSETTKWAPSAIVTSTTLLGISYEHWVYILTAIYTILQIGDWIYTKIKLWRKRERT